MTCLCVVTYVTYREVPCMVCVLWSYGAVKCIESSSASVGVCVSVCFGVHNTWSGVLYDVRIFQNC